MPVWAKKCRARIRSCPSRVPATRMVKVTHPITVATRTPTCSQLPSNASRRSCTSRKSVCMLCCAFINPPVSKLGSCLCLMSIYWSSQLELWYPASVGETDVFWRNALVTLMLWILWEEISKLKMAYWVRFPVQCLFLQTRHLSNQ